MDTVKGGNADAQQDDPGQMDAQLDEAQECRECQHRGRGARWRRPRSGGEGGPPERQGQFHGEGFLSDHRLRRQPTLAQFVYDLWLWSSLGGARNAAPTSLRGALAGRSFSPLCWRNMHAGLVDCARQIGFFSLFITIAPLEMSAPYHRWLEDELRKACRSRTHLPAAETFHLAHLLFQVAEGLLAGTNKQQSSDRRGLRAPGISRREEEAPLGARPVLPRLRSCAPPLARLVEELRARRLASHYLGRHPEPGDRTSCATSSTALSSTGSAVPGPCGTAPRSMTPRPGCCVFTILQMPTQPTSAPTCRMFSRRSSATWTCRWAMAAGCLAVLLHLHCEVQRPVRHELAQRGGDRFSAGQESAHGVSPLGTRSVAAAGGSAVPAFVADRHPATGRAPPSVARVPANAVGAAVHGFCLVLRGLHAAPVSAAVHRSRREA